MSPGWLLLEGGSEFGGGMAAADRRALELAGGPDAVVRIIPTAAAPDNNHARAGGNGVRWFRSLGAADVEWLPLIDASSANDPALAEAISHAGLIFLLGGFPGYLFDTLAGSLCWNAMGAAHAAGAVLAGSSAGAMVLGSHFLDPGAKRVRAGLGLVPGMFFLPHFNHLRNKWLRFFPGIPGEARVLCVDEETGVLNDGANGAWTVYGRGSATVYTAGKGARYPSGANFSF